MKLLAVFALFVAVSHGQEGCPAYPAWMPQTEQCLWFPLNEMRQDMFDACALELDADQFPTPPPFPQAIRDQLPGKCGYCSFKFQCRKRPWSEGCFPLEGKHETCTEFPDVCDMPKTPMLNNCNWGIFMDMLKQCINRPVAEIAEWKRDEFKKWGKMMPQANCVEKDGRCKCCCHPYKPSPDGSTCDEVPAQECQAWGDYNDWSECMWGMPQQIISDFRSHCGIAAKAGTEVTGDVNIPLPEGFEMPPKCGFCSFKVRCRKRDRRDGQGRPRCFPVDADKRNCGPEDCPTCGDVCTLPKLRDSCNYGQHIRKFLKSKMSKINRMPYWRKRGFKNIAKNLPHGNCIEKDGQCKCCCHPYAPNADGTSCELKQFCQLPEDMGMDMSDIFGSGSFF